MLLTAGERTLLHLLNFWNVKDPPEAITQQGIAAAAGLRRSHVPRTVKALAREGHLEERVGRVRGRGRKIKVYFLTEAGLRRARELAKAVEGHALVVEGGPTTLGELAKASGRPLLEIALGVDDAGVYRRAAMAEPSGGFLGRREELAALATWIRGSTPVIVVYGGRGMGKTALGRRFVARASRAHVWRDLSPEATADAVLHDLAAYLRDRGRDQLGEALSSGTDPWAALASDLAGLDVLFVFDNYGDVREDLVDAFGRLLGVLAGTPAAKALVLAEESTPSYCRFYHRRAVEARRVEEMHLRGLGIEECRDLLGNPDIAAEALRRIYLLTNGCPLYLELIREGDAKALKSRSRFTTAEINLLLFSRDVGS